MSLPVILVLIGLTATLGVVAFLLLRSVGHWPELPAWTWKEIRQLIALLATVGGAAVLTALAWWLIDILRGILVSDLHSPVALMLADGLVWGLKLLLAGVLLVILSLGLVIGPRLFSFTSKLGSANLGGGEDDAPAQAAARVAGAAVDEAVAVQEEAK
jgi:hypothetical protein